MKNWNMGIALVAIYMLVLQGMLGAFAMGAASASPMLDAFGNPICITSDNSVADAPDPVRHTPLPDCCVSGCSMFAPVTADEREPRSLANPLSSSVTPLRAPDRVDVHAFTLERGPGSPRSPPAHL